MTQDITRTGLIGHPVSHSKSPLIHAHWMKHYNVNGCYDTIDLSCEDLEEGISNLIKQGYTGLNITVPHKVAVMELCDEIDELAKIVGAANTITIKDKKLFGTNTDVFGFTQNILENSSNFKFSAGPALVLGAGGAARAVIEGLIQKGVPEIRLSNRTKEKAKILLESSSQPQNIKLIDWEKRNSAKAMKDINLLVNTTALGMSGKTALEIDLEYLPKETLVNDIVYAPLMTELLKSAQNRGNPVVTGIGMLLHQARPGFKLWHGVMPEVTRSLQELVLK